MLIDIDMLSPLWAVPFPRQWALACIRKLDKHDLMTRQQAAFFHGLCFKFLLELLL